MHGSSDIQTKREVCTCDMERCALLMPRCTYRLGAYAACETAVSLFWKPSFADACWIRVRTLALLFRDVKSIENNCGKCRPWRLQADFHARIRPESRGAMRGWRTRDVKLSPKYGTPRWTKHGCKRVGLFRPCKSATRRRERPIDTA